MNTFLSNLQQLHELTNNKNQFNHHSVVLNQPFEIQFNFEESREQNEDDNYQYLIKELKIAYSAFKNQMKNK
jgi:hypothetical protein